MATKSSKKPPKPPLKQGLQIKKEAIELRLAGYTLAEVAKKTGFSPPTVAKLVKLYRAGGHEAIEQTKPGRPVGGSHEGAKESEELKALFLSLKEKGKKFGPFFNTSDLSQWFSQQLKLDMDERAAKRRLADWGLLPPDTPNTASTFSQDEDVLFWARGPKNELFVMPAKLPLLDEAYCAFFEGLHSEYPKGLSLHLFFAGLSYAPQFQAWLTNHPNFIVIDKSPSKEHKTINPNQFRPPRSETPLHINHSTSLTHLQRLEAESIAIMREVVAEAENPVMLYSIGKDSTVMVRLAVKAFYPAKVPFPLLHIDSTWEFQQMYAFSEWLQKEHDLKLISHINQEGIDQGINPFTHGSQIHTDVLRTQGLKQALDKYGFDVAFGGGRRDEEKSRAKERIFSFRTKDHRWDPKNQRPELWNLYNAKKHKGESIRVFPISNWTELDIWQYIYIENIPIVPLYFSAPRPVVYRDGTLIMVDDDRMPLAMGELPVIKQVRFRTLGCYPFTGAVESTATTLEDIIQEMLLTKTSERQGRVIDHDGAASMEKKKQEGYF
jgi:sulfate adenylyltransferase subunit 2